MRGKKWNGRCVATRVDVPVGDTAPSTPDCLASNSPAVGWRLTELMSLGAW
ncbi:hypothetical protein EXIGLDRAFT_729388 [Exidia glandulosa HHB12029]|uniref:Uncharacterized protein n=1 Tax=Exidia glandulosa HHB12029 TaxID=1314781 RepID=A0A165CKN5_EXIGL|nr:hypothetical protein EXIGLDRAFT_729388 [Exidia glandulosa HHB12029]